MIMVPRHVLICVISKQIKLFLLLCSFTFVVVPVSAKATWCNQWGQHLSSPDGQFEIWLEPELSKNPQGIKGGAALYFGLCQNNKLPSSSKPIWENGHWLSACWSPDSKWILIDDSMHYRGHLVIFGIKEGIPVKVFETEAQKENDFPDFEFYYKVEKWLPEKDEVLIKVINRGTAFPKVQRVKVHLKV